MIRNLLYVAGSATDLCVASFAGAMAVAGYDLKAHGGNWNLIKDGTVIDIHSDVNHKATDYVSQSLKFDAKDRVRVDIPYDVDFQQGPAGSVTVEGPKSVVDRIRFEQGQLYMVPGPEPKKHISLRFTGHSLITDEQDGVSIHITAPQVVAFQNVGSGDLTIRQYDQKKLDLDVSGSGNISVQGRVDTLKANLSGSGDIDLKDLVDQVAEVLLEGSGDIDLAPLKKVEITSQGSGDINLHSHPVDYHATINGSGEVNRDE